MLCRGLNLMLDNLLLKMLKDLNNYKKDKNSLNKMYVEQRLNKQTESYIHDLSMNILSLQNRNALKILKEDQI